MGKVYRNYEMNIFTNDKLANKYVFSEIEIADLENLLTHLVEHGNEYNPQNKTSSVIKYLSFTYDLTDFEFGDEDILKRLKYLTKNE